MLNTRKKLVKDEIYDLLPTLQQIHVRVDNLLMVLDDAKHDLNLDLC